MTITERSATFGSKVRAGSKPNSVIFPLSSEEPYRRYEGIEILDHSPESVNLAWLNSGNAPLLDSHNRFDGLDAQLGVVERAWIEDKRVYVEVRFSNRQKPQEIMADLRDGIVTNVSVGYDVHKRGDIDEDTGEYRVTLWTPKEASLVSIPADTTVGVGRSDKRKVEQMPKPAVTLPGAPPPENEVTDEQRAEQLETVINEVTALAAEHNLGDIARSYIQGCVQRGDPISLELFRGIARSKLPEDTPLVNQDIGLTDTEKRQFSITRLMRGMIDGPRGAEFEFEAVAAAAEARGEDSKYGGFFLPTDLMRSWSDFAVDGVHYRDASPEQMARAAMATGGNPNVLTTAHLAARFIDNLRNMSSVLRAGATMLPGLSDNVEIPGGDQNITAAWLAAEDADVAESVPTFRKIELAPKDLGAFTDVTRRMLQQSTIAMEAYIRMQMVDAMRIAIDLAGLYGSGVSGVPEGVANTTGIGSVTFAAAVPTRDEIIDMRTSIAETNRGRGLTYIGNSGMVGDLQKTRVDAGSGIFLMGDDASRLVGNSFVESNQVTDGDLFGGVWSDMLIGMWGGLELARSTEAKFLSGGLRFRVIQTVDMDFTRVGSFVLGNDGA